MSWLGSQKKLTLGNIRNKRFMLDEIIILTGGFGPSACLVFYKSCDFQTIVGWLWMIGSSNRGIVEGGGVCVQFFFWIEMSKRKASKFAIFLGNENPNIVLFIFFSQVQFFMGHFIKHKHFYISEEWLFLFLIRQYCISTTYSPFE